MKLNVYSTVLLACLAVGCADTNPTGPTTTIDLTPGRITLEAFPQTVLLSGSDVRITVRVQTVEGTNATGARVRFTTTAGTLTPSEATVDGGFASTVLTASEPATVTATADGVSASREVGATAPFAVRLVGPTAITSGAEWAGTVTIEPNIAVVNPPAPSRLRFQCGSNAATEQPMTGASTQTRCRFSEPGTYTMTASAVAANGWTTSASSSVIVSSAPAPAPVPAPVPSVTIDATEVHRTATSALWRVAVRPVNGTLEGDIGWDFDYTVPDPTAPGATREVRQTSASDPEEDVLYLAEGTRQIRVRATVGSQSVTASTTITVAFR